MCFVFFCGAMFFGFIMAQLSEILAVPKFTHKK
jgi:hypothetical protein